MNPSQLALLQQACHRLLQGFSQLPPFEQQVDEQQLREVLLSIADRMQDNAPYFHPFYLGQMLKPPHPVAQLSYALAMVINPNNHALDGGRASSRMEQECIHRFREMIGWDQCLGHLTGGGTLANFEALWVSRQLAPGKVCVASSQAHYTHSRLTEVLQVPFQSVAVDSSARMDLEALKSLLDQGTVGTVVATLGTTGLGAVDPLAQLVKLRDEYGFRLHVDAAYGGYFQLAETLDAAAREAFDAVDAVDSLVIDPHKHGLVPYGCGCVLFRDPTVGRFYRHDSPYTYFSSDELHLGEISLECSRAGASAVALWGTLQMFPLVRGGDFTQRLDQSLEAARRLCDWLRVQPEFLPMVDPQLDLVVWGVRADFATASTAAARRIYELAEQSEIHLALLKLPRHLAQPRGLVKNWDAEEVTCLRATLMKPEHLTWLPRILERLDEVLMEFRQSGTGAGPRETPTVIR